MHPRVHGSEPRPRGSQLAAAAEEEQPLTAARDRYDDAVVTLARLLPMGLGYTLCSSSLMVVNKLAIRSFPFPSTLMAIQFFSAAAVVRILAAAGRLEAEPLDSGRVRQFIVVPIAFVLAIFSNIKVLQAASVETTVVFRSLVPLITSLADYAFMGRHLPSAQSLTGAQSTYEPAS